jgi:cell division protein FtsL
VNARIQRSSPRVRAAMAAMVGLAVGAGAVVWARTRILVLRYELTSLVEREAELHGDVEKLRLEVAALTTPERIVERAASLGLRYPVAGEVIVLEGAGAPRFVAGRAATEPGDER